MGYGHERPAHVLRDLSGGSVTIANDYLGIPDSDRQVWETTRTWYERISRFKKVPIIGNLAFAAMDEIQRIPDFYPRRDLSRPSLQVREMYLLIKRQHHCRHLIEKLAANPRPLISSYMTPAFAAEEFGYPEDIYLIICDADMSRAWAPFNPKSSRIKYFAPNGRVVERLKLYGVKDKNIELTGFPLPKEAIGGLDATIASEDLKRRMCNLDPRGIFLGRAEKMMRAYLGPQFCPAVRAKRQSAVHISFAVGGAGAQQELAVTAVTSLKAEIKRGKITMTLIAGTRLEVAQYFRDALKNLGLGSMIDNGVDILIEDDRPKYFNAFARLMRKTDVLWTKPSELSFYTGLGIPIIMAPTVGSQEDFNRHWLQQVGGGVDQLNPRYANEWLFDWINSGALARMAWQGFIEAPTHGAYRIEDILFGRPNTIHTLPLVV